MQRTQRDEVDLAAEQVAELIGELFDLPAQLAPRTECVQDIDVAVGPGGPASLGAEDLKLCDPVPVAEVGQALSVDLDPSYPHDPRLNPEPVSLPAGASRSQPVPDLVG